MDANIAQLAHETKDLLAPVLPYLLPAAAEAGKAVLKKTGEKISLKEIIGLDALQLLKDRNFAIFFLFVFEQEEE